MKFNPLTDLTPSQRDTAVKQLGGVTENEISNLSSSIKTASQRTSGIVDLLKRDNSKIQSDLSSIRDLDRRLKIVIPIIPEKFGEAGNIYPDKPIIEPPKFKLPKFPKFPRVPPVVPTPSTQPQEQTQQQPQEQPEQQPGFNIREIIQKLLELGYTWEQIRKILEGLSGGDAIPGLAAITKPLTSFAGTLDKFLKEKPGTSMAIDLGTGGFGTAMSMFPTGARLLSRLGPKLAQEIFGAPAVTTLARPRISTYGVPIGPQPARAMPKPGPLRPEMVAPRPRPTTVASPTSVPYEDILKGLPTATGGRLGGQTVIQRAPLLKGFETGGLFRKGPILTPEEKALREAFLNFADEKLLKSFDDPKNIYSQLARSDVDKIVEEVYKKSDEITRRIFGDIGTSIPKKTVDPKKVFGPYKYTPSQIEQAVDVLKSPQAKGLAQPGSVANYMQLDHPEVRQGFLDYLLSAKKGDGTPNYGLYEKILRQIGLLGDRPTQIDDEAFRFILNYHKKVGLDPDLLIKELLNKQILPKETFLKYSDKIGDVIRSSKMSPFNVKPLDVGPSGIPGDQPILPGGPQSSIIGTPKSMDLASLGIDTSVEIQEIYYIVG